MRWKKRTWTEQEPLPTMILPATWDSVKEFLVAEVRRFS
jgi:hypothetical protein